MLRVREGRLYAGRLAEPVGQREMRSIPPSLLDITSGSLTGSGSEFKSER